MSNREFYQDTFSQVRSSTEIRWEDYRTMRRRKRNLRRVFTLAAALCALAVLSIAAAATGFFGLRDILLSEKGSVSVTDGDGVVRQPLRLAEYPGEPGPGGVACLFGQLRPGRRHHRRDRQQPHGL